MGPRFLREQISLRAWLDQLILFRPSLLLYSPYRLQSICLLHIPMVSFTQQLTGLMGWLEELPTWYQPFALKYPDYLLLNHSLVLGFFEWTRSIAQVGQLSWSSLPRVPHYGQGPVMSFGLRLSRTSWWRFLINWMTLSSNIIELSKRILWCF